MNILFITAFPPCQKTAGQDYTRRLLEDLVKKGHSIRLIYSEYPGHEPELSQSITILRTIKPSYKNCLYKPSFHPFFTKRFTKETLVFIKSIADNFDMLYFDFSQVHLYSLYINHPNKVLMCHDVIAQKFSRKWVSQLPWIKKCENKLLTTSKMIVTFSEKDCNFIKENYSLPSIHVNFYLKHNKFVYNENNLIDNRFCFYGAWNRDENTECFLWFLINVYPELKNDKDFVVIGGGLPVNLKQKIEAYPNIKYLGFVDDPVLEISKCQALIAPLHKGAGVKVKVIDALTSGTNVIGTNVAFEGIEDNINNKLFTLAEKNDEYINAINNWKKYTVKQKQDAATEFFDKYNKNHFTDLLK